MMDLQDNVFNADKTAVPQAQALAVRRADADVSV